MTIQLPKEKFIACDKRHVCKTGCAKVGTHRVHYCPRCDQTYGNYEDFDGTADGLAKLTGLPLRDVKLAWSEKTRNEAIDEIVDEIAKELGYECAKELLTKQD